MYAKVASTMEMNGIEKSFCVHGGWVNIGHAAHLTGDRSTLIQNAPDVIRCLLKRHPRMRSRIRVDAHGYLLETFEYNSEELPVGLFFSMIEGTNESWQQIVENRCNRDPYSNNGTIIFPLFHFILLSNRHHTTSPENDLFHLLLFTNHCVSDGRSGYILINDFLTLATTSNLLEIFEPIQTDVLPFITELIPRPYGSFYPLLSYVSRRMIKQALRKPVQPRIPVKSIPLIDCDSAAACVQRYKLKFLFSSSSSNLYSNLHNQCRSHEVSLNGALFGCVLLAIHRCFPLKNEKSLEPYSVGLPFDMRARLAQSPLTSSSIGFFVGVDDIKLDRSLPLRSTCFWSFAHLCMTITRKKLEKAGIPLTMHILADMVRNDRQYEDIARLFPEGREGEFAFSNVGKYLFSCDYNREQVRLRGMHVVNNSSVHRISSTLFVTCAGDSQFDLSLAHEMASDEKAQEFLDFYLRLIEICGDDRVCKTETTLNQLLQVAQ